MISISGVRLAVCGSLERGPHPAGVLLGKVLKCTLLITTTTTTTNNNNDNINNTNNTCNVVFLCTLYYIRSSYITHI